SNRDLSRGSGGSQAGRCSRQRRRYCFLDYLFASYVFHGYYFLKHFRHRVELVPGGGGCSSWLDPRSPSSAPADHPKTAAPVPPYAYLDFVYIRKFSTFDKGHYA